MNSEIPATSALIEKARAGDRAALEALLDRHREYVRLLARCRVSGRLQARVDSSDLIQETLLRVAQHFPQFRGTSEEEWRGWLACIAEHEIIRQRRHHLGAKKRAASREYQERTNGEQGESLLLRWFDESQTSPSLAAMRKERALALADALTTLPEDYREVLILRHLEGLDFMQVAQRMERTSGAVRVLWTRALKKLRETLQLQAVIE